MQTLPKVLVVEDDRSIASALSQVLRTSHNVVVATTAQSAFYKVDSGHYDLILLDLNLPDMPGKAVCQRWRESGLETPILVLTADNQILTKVNLLDIGANDYLTKPFSLGELKARMRVLTRGQTHRPKQPVSLNVADVELNRQKFEVYRDGKLIQLRLKEFTLLECLMEHAGSVVTRRALIRFAWPGTEDLWTNAVDVHIKHLRDKIDRPFDRKLIRTVHGIGYRFELEAAVKVRQ
ncbi:MAG TPA: response regulator transcription factor [Candidatus Saccharimonadales bacterium]|nr:response regulator transcription factor [Candidatus Saccharimonadales bacterium]